MDESRQIGYSNQMNPRNSYFINNDTNLKNEKQKQKQTTR